MNELNRAAALTFEWSKHFPESFLFERKVESRYSMFTVDIYTFYREIEKGENIALNLKYKLEVSALGFELEISPEIILPTNDLFPNIIHGDKKKFSSSNLELKGLAEFAEKTKPFEDKAILEIKNIKQLFQSLSV